MAIYSYLCSYCNHAEDKITTFSKKDEQQCSKCNEKTTYQPSFKVGGVLGLPNGYAPTRSKSRQKKEIGDVNSK